MFFVSFKAEQKNLRSIKVFLLLGHSEGKAQAKVVAAARYTDECLLHWK